MIGRGWASPVWRWRAALLGAVVLTSTVLVQPVLARSAESDLDTLVTAYRSYGLPFPPSDAPLVRFVYGHRILGRGKEEPIHQLAFLLEPGTADKTPLLLVGTEEYRPKDKHLRVSVIEPQHVKRGDMGRDWLGTAGATFEVNADVATAIQCQARGWNELAKVLLAHGLSIGAGHRFSPLYQPPGLPPRAAIAHLAWAHWGNELVRPGTDRAAIAGRMQALIRAEPRLDTLPNRALLRSLEAALAPRTAQPGSVESLIDELVDLHDLVLGWRSGGDLDSRYLKLIMRGFQAVPALIDHLDDDRLTRSVQSGFNNFPSWHRRVKDVVSDLIQGMAGEEIGKDWLMRQKGYQVEKAAAQAWWEKRAQPAGEEAYMVAHVLPPDPKAEWPMEIPLRIVTARYPHRLSELYRGILEQRPSMQSWPLTKAISASSLTLKEKRALLTLGATHRNLAHRTAAYGELRSLDPEGFVTFLVRTLDGLPATPAEPYWSCPEAPFAILVTQTPDPRAWDALRRGAMRADVGLRMEMLWRVGGERDRAKHRPERVSFLAGFLQDTAVRDSTRDTRRFIGPFAGHKITRLAVRDLAPWQLVSLLDSSADPTPDNTWPPRRWATLRAQAIRAVEREPRVPGGTGTPQ
jgi:hypothetical protein